MYFLEMLFVCVCVCVFGFCCFVVVVVLLLFLCVFFFFFFFFFVVFLLGGGGGVWILATQYAVFLLFLCYFQSAVNPCHEKTFPITT